MSARVLNPQRRSFVRQLIGRAARQVDVLGGELRGRPQLPLGELGTWPDAVLCSICPEWSIDIEPELHGSDLALRDARTGALVQEVRLSNLDCAILARFGRNLTLHEISTEVCLLGQNTVPAGSCFARTRELFVRLARCGMCCPSGPLAES